MHTNNCVTLDPPVQWSIRQDSTFWSSRQMLNLVRIEKLLDVVDFINFLRILQNLSNILHPSRQNWTTKVWFFCKWKIIDENIHLLLTSYFFLVCLNGKLLSVPYIIPPCLISWILSKDVVLAVQYKVYLGKPSEKKTAKFMTTC